MAEHAGAVFDLHELVDGLRAARKHHAILAKIDEVALVDLPARYQLDGILHAFLIMEGRPPIPAIEIWGPV